MTTLAAATVTGLSQSVSAAEQSWIEETLAKQRAERGVAQGRAGFPATNSYAAKSVLASRQTIRQMDAAIGRYQAIHRSGGWPSIPGGRILRHGDDNAKRGQLRALITSRQQQTIPLRRPVDVHFVYITAWATSQRSAQFRSDIYRKDQRNVRTASLAGWSARTHHLMPR